MEKSAEKIVAEQELSFEKAYGRLEEILDKMSKGAPLEESLTLYEEADKLLSFCSKKLDLAEQKIQVLIKNRDGQIVLNDNNEPVLEDFHR